MSTYNGACHCGATEWTASLDKDTSSHILCHCNTCKILSGGAYTLNQIIPKDSLKITKGGDALKNYTYKGDSGNPVHCYYCPECTVSVDIPAESCLLYTSPSPRDGLLSRMPSSA